MNELATGEPDLKHCGKRFAALNWVGFVYLISLLGVWIAIHFGGDRYWLPTVIMFGPKWIYATPIPILLIWMISTRANRSCWLTLTTASLVLLFPISRFCVPQNLMTRGDVRELRILTFNVRGGEFDTSRLQDLLHETTPDVVCIQEHGGGIGKVFDETWNLHQADDLLVASRHPAFMVATVNRQIAGRWPRPIGLIVEVNIGSHSFHLVTVHPLSPRHGLSDITSSRTILAPSRRGILEAEIAARRDEHRRIHEAVAALKGPVLIAGDFNTPTSSTIYRKFWTTFQNAFSHTGSGFGHTIWIEQGHVSFSARIDQVLSSSHWTPLASWVGPDAGSDHRPLLADFRFSPQN